MKICRAKANRKTSFFERLAGALLTGVRDIHMFKVLTLALFFASLALAEPLHVHIVAHTHDDPGWLKTMEGYFVDNVKHVLDTVVDELPRDPKRRFIYVETSFFSRWWQQATDAQKAATKKLVANGQLEIVLGGWVMNDEAVVGYQSIVNQMTEGHEFMMKTLGVRPRIAWHIDPFGASCVSPALFADMGFDAFIINRIPYPTLQSFQQSRSLEFIWRSAGETASRGTDADMWTHVLDHHYCMPKGFDFEGDPYNNPPITPANVKDRAQVLVDECKSRSTMFRHNHLLLPFGCDFSWQNATVMYENMDALIAYVNAHSAELGVDMAYSTLSEYVDAVHALNMTWSRYSEDFFPYADNPLSYWTGFYTSHPWLKGFAITRAGALASVEQSHVLASLKTHRSLEKDVPALDALRQATSLIQHHDAITGTEKTFVAADYAARLTVGMQQAVPALSAGQTVAVVVKNTLGWDRPAFVRLTMPVDAVTVTDAKGNTVPAQVDPTPRLNGNYTLHIRVQVGISSPARPPAHAHPSRCHHADPSGCPETYFITPVLAVEDTYLSNPFYEVGFSGATGRLINIAHKETARTVAVAQDLLWYQGETSGQASGAYIFRPHGSNPDQVTTAPVSAYFVRGALCQEAVQMFKPPLPRSGGTSMGLNSELTDPSCRCGRCLACLLMICGDLAPADDLAVCCTELTQVLRLYQDTDPLVGGHIEIENSVGLLAPGRELITRFTTDLQSGSQLVSDLNAWEMHTSSYDSAPSESVSGNYHPIVSTAAIIDPAAFALVINTERPQGAASLRPGMLEIMMHRRLTADDSRGVGEPLNDQQGIDTTFWLSLIPAKQTADVAAAMRQGGYALHYPADLFYSVCPSGRAGYVNSYLTHLAPLAAKLPENIHLLTLAARGSGNEQVVIRLAHIYSGSDPAPLSAPAKVDLASLLDPSLVGSIATVEERTLSLNRPVTDLASRLHWDAATKDADEAPARSLEVEAPLVTVGPMQLRTFVVTFRQ
ncbi:putative Lysosomal alpha-mannosidase [Paratrimastix pyriformis]|uniref:Lysosomal alpha-mannosidase n=1 Tax=Paratrimastix pyriformis TaxID=342808 RepID=A0ABQ8UYI2_9EUKA|nr:putative Lysosomal alpha-mannosidase [Paratrimastix pyriformis]